MNRPKDKPSVDEDVWRGVIHKTRTSNAGQSQKWEAGLSAEHQQFAMDPYSAASNF